MNFNAAMFRKFAGTPKSSGSPNIKKETMDSPDSNNTQKEDQSSDSQTPSTPQRVDKTDIFCVPGDRLCKAIEKTVPGSGTYKSEDFIYASIAGQVVISYTSVDVKLISVEGIKKKTFNSLASSLTTKSTSSAIETTPKT